MLGLFRPSYSGQRKTDFKKIKQLLTQIGGVFCLMPGFG
jgi:hypothetical protein